MWSPKIFEHTPVESGTTITATFEYLGDKIIKSVTGQCGCTGTTWTSKGARANFTPETPYDKEEMTHIKNINVIYSDGTGEILTLKVKSYGKRPR